MKLLRFIAALVLFATSAAESFSNGMRPPVEDGLSNRFVNCMDEDDEGYIWIGTRRGLNRFNGSTYKVYYRVDSLSLANDFVSSILCDTEGRVWVGTTTGVHLLKDGEVVHDVNVNCGPVFGIVSYDDRSLLVLSRSSLYVMDKESLSMTLVYQDEYLDMGNICMSEDGNVWIYDVYNPEVRVLSHDFTLIKEISSDGRHVSSVCSGMDGSMFVATDYGLECFDSYGNRMALSEDLSERTDGMPILFVTSNREGRMSVGIKGKGIYIFTGLGNDIHRVWTEEDFGTVSSACAVLTETDVFVSKDNDGMEFCAFSSDRNVLPVSFSQKESLNMFYPLSGNKVLVLTNKKAYVMEVGSESVKEVPMIGSTGRDRLSISMFDSDSCLWILQDDNRLCRYSFDGNRMRLLAGYDVSKTNSIWGGVGNDGVYVLQGGGILQIRKDGSMLRHRMMRYPDFWFCATTTSGMTYFLEDHGVWFFDDDKEIKRLPIDVNNPECLYEAADGSLWIGSQGEGIYVLDSSRNLRRRLTMNDGLPDNTTRSIIGDEMGNIWVSSRCEVYKVDSGTYEVTLYGNPENMNLSYNTNSCHITEGGYVLMGSRTHIAAFSTRNTVSSNRLEVRLDGLVLNGVPVDAVPDDIELEPDGNAITFFYSAMNYDAGMKLSYRYMIEGYHDDWVYVGTAMRANFAGLKRGRYNFIVAVRDSSGMWSERTLNLRFRVKPAPWQSVPAILAYIILLLVVVALMARLINKLKANREELEYAEHQRLLNESLAKEKTDFFTNISHEYRTPLTLIYGPVKELSLRNSLNEHDRYLLSLIMQNTERMMKLTDQVLNVYSYDKENLKILKSDVSAFLGSMLNSFEYMFRQKELTLVIDIPQNLKAYCDREKVERIFFNIISNAVKYTPEGGEISVKAGVADDKLTISVADTGIGISPENMRKIFNRFERAGMENSENNVAGFGIGLNYAMHLSVLHKGLLTVSPNVPKGSVFTISIPSSKNSYDPSVVILDTDTANENAIVSNESEAGGIKAMTALIAEDNVELAGYIRHLLHEEYNVIVASNGNEALECMKVSAPDIIISDIMMPYKDGYALCSEIKSDPEYCHLPVILLTAKSDLNSNLLGFEAGADAYLKKPFEPDLLLMTLKNILENRKRLQSALSSGMLASDRKDLDEMKNLKMSSHDRVFIDKLKAMMEAHLADEEFNVTAMSKEFGMSRTSLFSKIKTLYGTSPQAWITDYRLGKAMELLQTREFNVSEVSYKVGFATLTGFSRSFKNKFGIPPSAV